MHSILSFLKIGWYLSSSDLAIFDGFGDDPQEADEDNEEKEEKEKDDEKARVEKDDEKAVNDIASSSVADVSAKLSETQVASGTKEGSE